jgi:hypothetical protein
MHKIHPVTPLILDTARAMLLTSLTITMQQRDFSLNSEDISKYKMSAKYCLYFTSKTEYCAVSETLRVTQNKYFQVKYISVRSKCM